MGVNIAVAYSDPDYSSGHLTNPSSFIWSIENSNAPLLRIEPKSPLRCIEYNPKDPFILASGQHSGQVSIWDTRVGGTPTIVSEPEVSHTSRVNGLSWTASKTSSDFFSGSSDGSLYFWDTRTMHEPIESLLIDIEHTNEQNRHRSHGVSVVEYEPTIPTRYMVGTEQGYVFACNRKANLPTEKILSRFRAHVSQVNSLERNTAFVKNFLTVGDFCCKIWSEEYRDAPIIWSNNSNVLYLSGTWSAQRCSVIFITRYDGTLEVWDLLIRQDEPVLQLKLSDSALKTIRVHEATENVALGSRNGVIYLMNFSQNLVNCDKTERAALANLFERETRREKYYDARMREMRMKYAQTFKDEEKTNEFEKTKKKKDVKKKIYKHVIDAMMEPSDDEEASLVHDNDDENAEKTDAISAARKIKEAELEYLEMIRDEENKRMKNKGELKIFIYHEDVKSIKFQYKFERDDGIENLARLF